MTDQNCQDRDPARRFYWPGLVVGIPFILLAAYLATDGTLSFTMAFVFVMVAVLVTMAESLVRSRRRQPSTNRRVDREGMLLPHELAQRMRVVAPPLVLAALLASLAELEVLAWILGLAALVCFLGSRVRR